MSITAAQVQQLYVAYLGRAADRDGLDYWLAELNAPAPLMTLENLRANFVNEQPEYQGIYNGLSREDTIKKIYLNLFGRTFDADGLKYWTVGEGASVNADQLLVAFINGASAADAKVVDNKVIVSESYTNATGSDYRMDIGADLLTHIDGTAESVTCALDAIAAGTLPGQVPGLKLINALKAAQLEVTEFESLNKAAIDALAAKLNVILPADGNLAAELSDMLNKAVLVREAVNTGFRGDPDTTVLIARAAEADAVMKNSYNQLSPAQKMIADEYLANIAAEKAAEAAIATAAEKAAAISGLDSDVTAQAGMAALGGTAASIYTDYIYGYAESRASIDTALKDSLSYAAFKAAVAKDAAYVDAVKATLNSVDALDSDIRSSYKTDVFGGTVLSQGDSISGGASNFVVDVGFKMAADAVLADSQAADADIAFVKALIDAYTLKSGAVDAAEKALDDFNNAYASTVATHALDGAVLADGVTGIAAIKDVFYFADQTVAADSTHDFNIACFGAGDSFVIGSGLNYNSGALNTGDANKAEFFLVQKGADTLVVLETTLNGSSTVDHIATTDATSVSSPDAVVITLTGVAIADLTVHNGVISHAD